MADPDATPGAAAPPEASTEGVGGRINSASSLAQRLQPRLKSREASIGLAKKRALEGSTAIFDAASALSQVAEPDGEWNWALVGPNPQALRLSAGGTGGAEEMSCIVGRRVLDFGLLRMNFRVEEEQRTGYLFIRVSNPSFAPVTPEAETKQAEEIEADMERAIRQFVDFTAKVHVQSPEDCSIERLIGVLHQAVKTSQAGAESADEMNLASFNAAVAHHRETNAQFVQRELEKQDLARHLLQIIAEGTEESELTELVGPETEESRLATVFQRGRVKLYEKGDPVEIYSSKTEHWMDDGEVVETVLESCVRDGADVRAGSTKIVYAGGTRFKWVSPGQLTEIVRPSFRPPPPDPVVGFLDLEYHGWFMTSWSRAYVELNKGFLQYWWDVADCKQGKPPNETIFLLGLQEEDEDRRIKMRSYSTNGAVSVFQTEDKLQVAEWADALWVHAGFCEEEILYCKKSEDIPTDVLAAAHIARTHRKRKSIAASVLVPVTIGDVEL